MMAYVPQRGGECLDANIGFKLARSYALVIALSRVPVL